MDFLLPKVFLAFCFCNFDICDVDAVLFPFLRRNIFQRFCFLSFFPVLSFVITPLSVVSVMMVEGEEAWFLMLLALRLHSRSYFQTFPRKNDLVFGKFHEEFWWNGEILDSYSLIICHIALSNQCLDASKRLMSSIYAVGSLKFH